MGLRGCKGECARERLGKTWAACQLMNPSQVLSKFGWLVSPSPTTIRMSDSCVAIYVFGIYMAEVQKSPQKTENIKKVCGLFCSKNIGVGLTPVMFAVKKRDYLCTSPPISCGCPAAGCPTPLQDERTINGIHGLVAPASHTRAFWSGHTPDLP